MAKTPPKADTKKEAAKAPGAGAEEQAKPFDSFAEQAIVINGQFIKDLSFEVPGAPAIYSNLQETKPVVNLNFNVTVNPVQDNMAEVVLEIQAECKIGEQVAYIFELEYAGLFTINVPEEHFQPILLIECPRLLFPFARNVLADVTRDGGFAPLMLGPVDFAGMYQAKLQELEKAKTAGGDAKETSPS
jgi:preprotein translocase subunit SecB